MTILNCLLFSPGLRFTVANITFLHEDYFCANVSCRIYRYFHRLIGSRSLNIHILPYFPSAGMIATVNVLAETLNEVIFISDSSVQYSLR